MIVCEWCVEFALLGRVCQTADPFSDRDSLLESLGRPLDLTAVRSAASNMHTVDFSADSLVDSVNVVEDCLSVCLSACLSR